MRHVPSQGKCAQTPLLMLSWKAESRSVGHRCELDSRTAQEKKRERDKGTSHPSYRAATAERLVKEGKEADPGNNVMIS